MGNLSNLADCQLKASGNVVKGSSFFNPPDLDIDVSRKDIGIQSTASLMTIWCVHAYPCIRVFVRLYVCNQLFLDSVH